MSIENSKLMNLADGKVLYDDLRGRIDENYSDLKNDITDLQADFFSKYNVLPPESVPVGTIKNVTITRTDDVFTFAGTANGSDSKEGLSLPLIPGEKYTVKVYTTSNKSVNASVRYRTAGGETNLGSFGTTSVPSLTFTCPSSYTRIYVKLGVINGVVYSDDEFKISMAVGESNPQYVKYGEGVSAYDGYARNKILSIEDEIASKGKFVTPEMFGAKGDGSENDTQAIVDCIAYGNTNGIPVLGFAYYRIRQAITISGNYQYIYLHRVYCSDSVGTAITVKKSYNRIIIDELNVTGANTQGIALVSDESNLTVSNIIQIQKLYANGNAIYLEGDSTHITSYNTFMLNYVSSGNGNAIHNGDNAIENQFYNARIECPNGWAIYKPAAMRCFGFSMEQNVLNGILISGRGAGGSFYGFRHVEMTDKLVARLNGDRLNTQGGTLIKIVGNQTQFNYESEEYVPYQAIDTSEMLDYTDPSIDVDPPTDWYVKWTKFNTATLGAYIYGKIKYGQFNTKNGGFPIGHMMHIVAGKKICKPVMESNYSITDALFDMRDDYEDNDNNQPYATRFTIDVANCVIHLAPSYCCMGYNKLIIDQSTPEKLCTVYNSYDDQNPIFNGQTAGAGVYELSCTCDLSETSEQIAGTSNYYTGRNDLWTVTKIG